MHAMSQLPSDIHSTLSAEQEVWVLDFCCIFPCLAFIHLISFFQQLGQQMLGSESVCRTSPRCQAWRYNISLHLSPCTHLLKSLSLLAFQYKVFLLFYWVGINMETSGLAYSTESFWLFILLVWWLPRGSQHGILGRIVDRESSIGSAANSLCSLGQISLSDRASACAFVTWRCWTQWYSCWNSNNPISFTVRFRGNTKARSKNGKPSS